MTMQSNSQYTQSTPPMRFGEFLVKNNKLEIGELNTALEKQRELKGKFVYSQLGNILLSHNYISEEVLIDQVEKYKKVNSTHSFNKEFTYVSTSSYVPTQLALEQCNEDVFKRMWASKIIIADYDVRKRTVTFLSVGGITRRDIEDFQYAVFRDTTLKATVYCVFEHPFVECLRAIGKSLGYGTRQLDETTYEINLQEKLVAMFRDAIKRKCSDVIIMPTRDSVVVKFKFTTHGEYYDEHFAPRDLHDKIARVILEMCEKPSTDLTLGTCDCQIASVFGKSNTQWSARGNIISTVWGYKVVLRLIPNDQRVLTLKELNMPPHVEAYCNANRCKSHGLFLITGHMGCGKNTTSYAVLDSMDKEKKEIATVEDPVERFIEGIAQTRIEGSMNFPVVAKSMVRQALDVMFIGELRDAETIKIAVDASGAGMFVMSTIHIDRLAEIWARVDALDPKILPKFIMQLTGIMTQRLVDKLCPHCRQEIKKEELPFEDQLYLENAKFYRKDKYGKGLVPTKYQGKFYKSCGCPKCKGKGIQGVAVVTEILPLTNSIKRELATKKSFSELEYYTDVLLEEQQLSFKYQGAKLLNSGQVSLSELRDKNMFDFNLE